MQSEPILSREQFEERDDRRKEWAENQSENLATELRLAKLPPPGGKKRSKS